MDFFVYFLVYIILTIIIIKYCKIKSYSILALFIVYCFLAYGLQGVLLYLKPQLSYVNSSDYAIDYNKVIPYYPSAFKTFLFGYCSFIIGYIIIGRKTILPPYLKTHPVRFWPVFVSFFLFNWFSFLFRDHYKAGVALYSEATEKFANYLYYSFNYLALVLLSIVVYLAVLREKPKLIIAALFAGINYGIALMLLGWKSGIVYALVISVHIFLLSLSSGKIKLHKFKSQFFISFLLFFIFTLFSFKIIPLYRSEILTQKKQLNYEFLSKTANSFSSVGQQTKTVLLKIINRTRGINSLAAIVALTEPGADERVSLIGNMFLRNSYHPETYFGSDVLKHRGHEAIKSGIHTEAPTGWGAMYVYHGNTSVIIGFFFFGLLAALFENAITKMIRDSFDYIGLYSIVYTVIFTSVVFEGTVFFFLKRHLGSLLFIFIMYKVSLHAFGRIRKVWLKG